MLGSISGVNGVNPSSLKMNPDYPGGAPERAPWSIGDRSHLLSPNSFRYGKFLAA